MHSCFQNPPVWPSYQKNGELAWIRVFNGQTFIIYFMTFSNFFVVSFNKSWKGAYVTFLPNITLYFHQVGLFSVYKHDWEGRPTQNIFFKWFPWPRASRKERVPTTPLGCLLPTAVRKFVAWGPLFHACTSPEGLKDARAYSLGSLTSDKPGRQVRPQ